MRNLLALLLTAMIAMSGCLSSDEPAVADDEPTTGDESMMEEPTEEDFGTYVLELATGHCHATEGTYTEDAPGVYQSGIEGGTWVMQESNGIPGLQYEDNHPGSGPGAGFELPVDQRCVDGDQVVA